MDKCVRVGISGVSSRLIELLSGVTTPSSTSHLVVENPALYLGSEFSSFHVINLSNCQLTSISSTPSEQALPIIASISGGGSAIGLWSADFPPPGHSTVEYGRASFSFFQKVNSTSKVSIHRKAGGFSDCWPLKGAFSQSLKSKSNRMWGKVRPLYRSNLGESPGRAGCFPWK